MGFYWSYIRSYSSHPFSCALAFYSKHFFVACTAIILGCSLDRCVNQEFSSFLITFCMYYQSFIIAVRITACLMLLSNQNLNNTKCECASNKKV